MIEVVWGENFKRKFKRLVKNNINLKEKFSDKLNQFCNEPFAQNLRTHKLSGEFSEYWSFSMDYRIRVIFRFIEEDKVLLISIGYHDEVY